MTTTYLLVEDNVDLRNWIADELWKSHSPVAIIAVDSGEEALAALEDRPDIDLVSLDLTLKGDMYGMDVLRRIRERSDIPVVIMSSDPDPERQIEAMELGASGFIDKERFVSDPQSGAPPVQIRRYLEKTLERSRSGGSPVSYMFDGWTLDPARRLLINPAGAAVALTGMEFDLLLVFVENHGAVQKPGDLITELGIETKDALTKLLSRLRRKIQTDGAPSFILNEYGRGFLFTPEVRTVRR